MNTHLNAALSPHQHTSVLARRAAHSRACTFPQSKEEGLEIVARLISLFD